MSKKNLYYLRINSNAEKKFLLKAGLTFDGLLIRANYFESSSGFLSGLLLKLASTSPNFLYIVDPVTYVFALDADYLRAWQIIKEENADKKLRKELILPEDFEIPDDWKQEITDPTPKQKGKIKIKGINRGYRKLANTIFAENLSKNIGLKSILPQDFNEETLTEFVNKVILYQKEHILGKYKTEKYEDFKNVIPKPSHILSPYFLISNDNWFHLMTRVWGKFEELYSNKNASNVLLINYEYLKNNFDKVIDVLSKNKSPNIFLWINNFVENNIEIEDLKVYTKFIIELSNLGKKIINLYPGGFSPFLIPHGLYGMVDNAGYGLFRDVSPVKGGLIYPKYYIPTLHIREAVLEAVDVMGKNKVGLTREDFLKDVCNCPICQEGIKKDYKDMILYFNELVPSKKNADKSFATVRAIERCNFHFILSRLIEYRWAIKASKEDAINRLTHESTIWPFNSTHITNWRETLNSFS